MDQEGHDKAQPQERQPQRSAGKAVSSDLETAASSDSKMAASSEYHIYYISYTVYI